jgi:hypothetical protein
MLKRYKNRFFHAIQGLGFDPAVFSAQTEKFNSVPDLPERMTIMRFFRLMVGDDAPQPEPAKGPERTALVIRLKDTELWFGITDCPWSFDHGSFTFTRFGPGFPKDPWSDDAPFEEILTEFERWLNLDVAKYLEEKALPDYWSEIEMSGSLGAETDVPVGEGEPFTPEEREEVRRAIRTFRGLVEHHFHPTAQQSDFINERLDYLSRAVDRLNRFDWRGVAVSMVGNVAVNLSVDHEGGRILFALFKQAFLKLLN